MRNWILVTTNRRHSEHGAQLLFCLIYLLCHLLESYIYLFSYPFLAPVHEDTFPSFGHVWRPDRRLVFQPDSGGQACRGPNEMRQVSGQNRLAKHASVYDNSLEFI